MQIKSEPEPEPKLSLAKLETNVADLHHFDTNPDADPNFSL
jgi:hypothetical protein